MEKFKPIIFRGSLLEEYYLDLEGNIYSNKRKTVKKLTIQNGCQHNPYPKIGLVVEGKANTIMVHRLVCETFHEKPIPDILTEEQWDSISEEIRNILIEYITHADRYQVNHIDHDINNFHPNNLEWVTAIENQQKYQEYKKRASI